MVDRSRAPTLMVFVERVVGRYARKLLLIAKRIVMTVIIERGLLQLAAIVDVLGLVISLIILWTNFGCLAVNKNILNGIRL